MAHIFNECQKYGFEILDDGIYNGDTKLGEVGCTKGNWWVILGSSGKAQYSNSVFDAVRALIPVSELSDAELDDCEQLLDLPFEMLTAHNYKCHQVASILHLNLSTVRLWINRGWLKVNRRCPKHYEIGIGHLKEFLDNPPQQIRKRIEALDAEAINYLLGRKV